MMCLETRKCSIRDLSLWLTLSLFLYFWFLLAIAFEVGIIPKTYTISKDISNTLHQGETNRNFGPKLVSITTTSFKSRKSLHCHDVITFSNGSWKTDDVCKFSPDLENSPDFFLVKSQSEAGSVSLFVHDPTKDAISGTIKDRRSFESGNVDAIASMLRKDPELSFIDIGTNVGEHAMAAALLGKQVIAVDAMVENIQHVCESVKYNKFSGRITLVRNAVSDSHEKLKFRHGTNGDFGLGHVDMDNIQSKMNAKFRSYFKNHSFRSVESVKLDDFLDIPCFSFMKNILIKIDVEGHEHRVLNGAKKFMEKKRKSIKGIMMEWQWFRGRDAENIILRLMKGWSFEPYRFVGKLELLNVTKTYVWPPDVLWLPIKDKALENHMKKKLKRDSKRVQKSIHPH